MAPIRKIEHSEDEREEDPGSDINPFGLPHPPIYSSSRVTPSLPERPTSISEHPDPRRPRGHPREGTPDGGLVEGAALFQSMRVGYRYRGRLFCAGRRRVR